MKVKLKLRETEELVAPDELVDVLNVLVDSGSLLSYSLDYTQDILEITVSKSVEVLDLFNDSEQVPVGPRKKTH